MEDRKMSEDRVINNFYDNSKCIAYVGNYYESAEYNNAKHVDDVDDVEDADFEVVDDYDSRYDEPHTEDKHVFRLGGRVEPTELRGAKARKVFAKLRNANILDEYDYPKSEMSWWQKGELADLIAAELCIQNTWKVFSQYWKMDTEALRSGFNKAKTMKKKMILTRKSWK